MVRKSCCELLSILYLCSVKHNKRIKKEGVLPLWIAFNFVSLQCETQLTTKTNSYLHVVNCFQFCIFAVWNTTILSLRSLPLQLWIAFNFVSLQCETQQNKPFHLTAAGCELLSILYLCSVKHNSAPNSYSLLLVVNCFQFCIFAVWNTTYRPINLHVHSCELLSILYLCSVKHN